MLNRVRTEEFREEITVRERESVCVLFVCVCVYQFSACCHTDQTSG